MCFTGLKLFGNTQSLCHSNMIKNNGIMEEEIPIPTAPESDSYQVPRWVKCMLQVGGTDGVHSWGQERPSNFRGENSNKQEPRSLYWQALYFQSLLLSSKWLVIPKNCNMFATVLYDLLLSEIHQISKTCKTFKGSFSSHWEHNDQIS